MCVFMSASASRSAERNSPTRSRDSTTPADGPCREGSIRNGCRALVGLTGLPIPAVSEKQIRELDLDLRAGGREHLRLLRRENGNTQRNPEETGGTREMSQMHEDLGLRTAASRFGLTARVRK